MQRLLRMLSMQLAEAAMNIVMNRFMKVKLRELRMREIPQTMMRQT
jgi:hypothetical protein